VSAETLIRLARALKISGWALLGDDSAWPSPRVRYGEDLQQGLLSELSEAECWRLISTGGVGRVIAGTFAVPVNYALHRGDIVFRTAAGGGLAKLIGSEIGFEIDQIGEGDAWS